MKDNPDLIKIWQEASKKIEETNKLTRSIIEKAIESKSLDVMTQFMREKKAGLMSGIFFIPIIIIGFFASFSVNLWSILFALILTSSLIFGIIDGIKQLRKIKLLDQTGSLSDNLTGKLKYLTRQFNRAKFLSPLLGVGIYLPLILIYRFLEYGDLILQKHDRIVLGVSIVVIVLLTSLMTRFQRSKYISPLTECLEELQNFEPPKINTRPRINIAVIQAIILAISMIVYWIVSR